MTQSIERKTVAVEVCDVKQYDGDWPTEGYPALLLTAIKWFKDKLELIPHEFRATARCEIDSVSSYEDTHYGHITITYNRPETDVEMAARIAALEIKVNRSRNDELTLLRRLQAKYEGDTK